MEKTEVSLTYTPEKIPALGKAILPQKTPKKRAIPWKEALFYGIFCGCGFFWSRPEVLQILHPLGSAYLSAFFGEGALFWSVLAAVGLGSMAQVPLKSIGVLISAAAVQLTLGRFVRQEEAGKKALLGAFSMALAGVFFAISRGGLGFYMAVAAVESALTLAVGYLLQKGVFFLQKRPKYPVLTREETVSLMLLSGGVLSGLATLEQPLLRQSLVPAMAAFLLLLAAEREGIGGGAAVGVFLGFLLYICGGGEFSLLIALSLGGMLAGCVRDLGRLASALAVVLTPVIFLFYIDESVLEPIWMGGLIIGSVVFSLFPRRLLEKMTGGRWEAQRPADRYTNIKEMTEEKLLRFSDAFAALSKTFVQEENRESKEEISKLVDAIAGRVCQDCGMVHYCWQEELYRTYSMTFSALSYCDSKGSIGPEQMPEHFRETCARTDAFMEAVHEVYESHRRDRLWNSRLIECRELVGQQLLAVGDILKTLSGQMEWKGVFLEETAEALENALRKAGIHPRKVFVTEEKNGRGRQVRLELPACGGKGICRDKILPLVQKAIGCPMVLQEEGLCHYGEREESCILHFQEEPPFCLTTATACTAAEEGQPSGDAAAFLQTEKGQALLALSDGMGVGEEAAKESRIAIELLEQFTQAGFDRELAIQMINSALLLRRGEETYATLDICHVDLFSGHAEFLKQGATASYISRGGRVISLRSTTLPAGILQQISVEKNEMLLKDGDMIFLMTDGVTDAIGGEQKTAAWLKEKLNACPMANPEDAAAYILQEAKKERQDGRQDDMTVLAGRFWQKRA